MHYDPILQTAHPSVVHAVTTRHAGESVGPYASLNLGLHVGDDPQAVISNRREACRALGFRLDDWVSGEQVHGAEIARVDHSARGRGARSLASAIPGIDGLMTASPGVLLTAIVADCLPIFYVDPIHPAVGVAHAGWRGTLAGIAARMVERLRDEYGSEPRRLQIWIGPGIGPCCFEVDESLAERFAPRVGADVRQRGEDGRWRVDLAEANRRILIQAGVPAEAIRSAAVCTACHTDRFYSHRAEGQPTGRMAGLIGLRP